MLEGGDTDKYEGPASKALEKLSKRIYLSLINLNKKD